MTEAKRTAIKDRIEAGESHLADRNALPLAERIGEKAIEAKDSFVGFAKQHPVATVAGGVALGVLVSALFRKSPTRKVAKQAGGKASALAAIAAKVALDYAQTAMTAANDARHAGADRLEDAGKATRSLGKAASRRASHAGDSARAAAHEARAAIGKALKRAR